MAMVLAFLVLLFAFLSIQVLFYLLLAEWELVNKMPVQKMSLAGKEELGISWAVIVACSSVYKNYRYQMLRKEGLKEENIIVFLYTDLVNNMLNPSLNIMINLHNGQDINVDAPQDYTGNQVTIENLYAVLLGNMSAVRGGSGKFVDSKPNDQIFVYYSNHGGPGVLGMPNLSYLFTTDFISLLQKKQESKSYKEMVFYVEACNKRRIFEGVIPQDLNIFVITDSNTEGSSWGTYCPRMDSSPPEESSNLKMETIGKKYQMVKEKTSNYSIEQGNVEPLFLWRQYKSLDDSSKEKVKVLKEIKETMKHRLHLDSSVDFIGKFIFGYFEGPPILQSVRPSNQSFVDDWDCLKSMICIFETHCGSLRYYGMKHSKAFANICNRGVSLETVETACIYACAGYYNENWSPLNDGF